VIEPYVYVRGVTMALGVWWTVMGLRRTLQVARAWRDRLRFLGFEDRWWLRQVTRVVLRATLLDPLNLALLCLLLALWSLPLDAVAP
jgi:hypothetical protein